MTETVVIAPSDEAFCLTGRDYLSWSQCQAYLHCPKAYWFRYVEGAEMAFTPSALVFGGAMHQCIRRHHDAQLEGREPPGLDEHRESLNAALSATDPPIRFGSREDKDGIIELGSSMLETFFSSEFSAPDGRVIAIEEPLRGHLDDNLPPIEGYVDLVFERDHELVVRDYKTSRSAWGTPQVNEHAGQLVIYGALQQADESEPDRTVSLEFVTITKQKTPKVQRHVVPQNGDQVATVTTVASHLRDIWTGISAGAFPARPGWGCATCPYHRQCPHAAL